MSLEHAMFVIVVPALGRFRASVPVQPALGAGHDATDLDHDTILANELPRTICLEGRGAIAVGNEIPVPAWQAGSRVTHHVHRLHGSRAGRGHRAADAVDDRVQAT